MGEIDAKEQRHYGGQCVPWRLSRLGRNFSGTDALDMLRSAHNGIPPIIVVI